MYKVVLVLVWLKEVKEVVVVTVETDCHLGPGNGGCNRSDGLPLVPGTPSQQSRSQGSGMDGQTPEGNVLPGFRTPCPSSSSHSNNKQMCHRMHRDLRARQTWMQVVKGIRCRDVNKETCQ